MFAITPYTHTPQANVEALIVGGGPAGAALAALLASRGREVEIVEQSSSMHHKVCGEFLSCEAASYLDRLGLDLRAMGAVPIHSIRLAGRRPIACCELPFPAMSMTRRKLDEALLVLAGQRGAQVRRSLRVEQLRNSGGDWSAQLSNGEARRARAIFLATGKHDVRGYRRPQGKQNGLIAFKMYFRLKAEQERALRGCVELTLFPGGYAGMQLTEDGAANLCLLVNRATLKKCRNDWQMLLEHISKFSEHIAERLHRSHPLLARPLALSSIPYGMLLSQSDLWRLGDQAAVTPSFSGDGMSIALHSALLAAQIYSGGGRAADLAQRLHKQLSGSIGLATFVSQLMIGAPALAHLLRAYPRLLRVLAESTRVPARALIA